MRTPEQTLTMLLNRAVHDDGIEGDNAWATFAERYRGTGGRVFILDEDYQNPLLFVVREQDRQIEHLKGQLDAVKRRAEKMRRQTELMAEDATVDERWSSWS